MSISPLLFRAWIAILTCALLAIGTAQAISVETG